MKIRESGMPQEEEGSKFFNPNKALKLLGVNNSIRHLVDFGCGYGTFTIPAAKLIQGNVYAIDVEPEMIKLVQQKAKNFNLNNIKTILRDFISEGSGFKDLSVDYVLLFNILHGIKPKILLEESHRILKLSGRVAIVHWKCDVTTPRGPPMDMRSKPEQCRVWAESVGFVFEKRVALEPYHYGLLFRK